MYYRLSRHTALHGALRRMAYAALGPLPDALKYGVGGAWRRHRLPYRLLAPGDTAIQIGAPWDTLRAGRSRAAHFARLVGAGGRVIVIEPAEDNVAAFEAFARRHGLAGVTVIAKGAWSGPARLRFLVNPRHPASNLVEQVVDTPARDLSGYRAVEIEADSLDNLVAGLGIGRIRVLSVNTNGSDRRIFDGAGRTLARTDHVAVVTRHSEAELARHGFELVGGDDRGFTYGRRLHS